MNKTKSVWRWIVLASVFALVVAACSPSDAGDDTTTTADAPDTTEAAPDETTTTEQMDDTTTTAGEEMDFGEPVTLNLGHPFPAQHPIQVGALEPFAQAVNEQTNGTVTIEFQPGGALAPPPGTFENTVAGGQEMGWALQGYHAGLFPVTEIVEQPFQFTSATQATQTLWALYDQYPELQAEYDDVQLIGLWTHDVGDIWTGDTPVQTTDDMQGLTMRFPTRVMGSLMEAMGASPVGMPAPEISDSLNTGVIDGLSIAVSGLASFNLFPPLLNYGTQCDCYVAAQYLVVNQDAWDGLTPDAQQVISDLGREYSLLAAEVYDDAYTAVLARALEEGIEIYELPEDEYANWLAVGDQVTSEWIADLEAQGVPAQQMYDEMQNLKTQFEG